MDYESTRIAEIASGLLSLEQHLTGNNSLSPASDVDCNGEDNSSEEDYGGVLDAHLVSKYRLDCPDWGSFKINCKSANKYCVQIERFLLWRERTDQRSNDVSPNALQASLINYFTYCKELVKNGIIIIQLLRCFLCLHLL